MPWRTVLGWVGLLVAAAVVVVAGIYVVFWPVSDLIARHDVGAITGPHRAAALQAARDAARGRLLTFGAGLFALGALVYTARNFTLSREGQVTDRYTKAIEQLGSEELDVRIGGIYALERVARDSARDHPTVMEVLAAFVREHSREQWPPPADEPGADAPERTTRPDVQAAITVIGRRNPRHDRQPVNLVGANLTDAVLTGAELSGADLTGAILPGANLSRAILPGAEISGAILTGAEISYADLSGTISFHPDLTDAHLIGANLTRAYLTGANFSGAILIHADLSGAILLDVVLSRAELSDAVLTGANLIGADLTRANLTGANLTGAELTGADLTGAGVFHTDLTGANLTRANLTGASLTRTNLARADLTDALWPSDTAVPGGWQRDTDSGRLRRTGIRPGVAGD